MKIAFFHMNQLGDLLFSLPVLSAARKQWPAAEISCIARPEHISLLEAAGVADRFIARPKNGIMAKFPLAAGIRNERFDKGIFFSESPECLMLGFAGGIKERVGFSTAGLRFLLTKKAERYGVPSMDNNKKLGLLAGLSGIPDDYSGLTRVPEKDLLEASGWFEENNIVAGKAVVIAPGASKRRKNKFWKQANWKLLAGRLIDAGYHPVFSGAPWERPELESLAGGMNGKAKVFVSERGIMKFAAVIKTARLFAGIDSGAMHLAASLGTKVVALFGPTDPAQVGPKPLGKNIVIKKEDMSGIDLEEVWQKVSEAML